MTALPVNDSAAYALISWIAVLVADGRPMLPEPGAGNAAFARVTLRRRAAEASSLGPPHHADPEKLYMRGRERPSADRRRRYTELIRAQRWINTALVGSTSCGR